MSPATSLLLPAVAAIEAISACHWSYALMVGTTSAAWLELCPGLPAWPKTRPRFANATVNTGRGSGSTCAVGTDCRLALVPVIDGLRLAVGELASFAAAAALVRMML